MSKHMINLTMVGNENCLVLNVYTPSLSEPSSLEPLKPVMVWIHGGAFVWGSGNTELYGPEYLLTEDIVLVTINYRIGLLGFLRFEDPTLEVPGNAGFKDQVMALRWVQDNIEAFNGNPGNVTIFGESAGGAAVHALILSPMARDLFDKAIVQSGSTLNPWTKGKSCTKELAEYFGVPEEEKVLLDYLMTLPGEKIIEAQNALKDIVLGASSPRYFGWVVETQTNEPAFLPRDPCELISSGDFNKIPTLMGYTSKEGFLLDVFINLKLQEPEDNFETKPELMVPFQLDLNADSPLYDAVKRELVEFYKGEIEDVRNQVFY